MDFLNQTLPSMGGFALSALLVAGLFQALSKGAIIPRPHHEDRIADKDKQIEFLKEADRKNQETISRLGEANKTIIQLLEGIQQQYDSGDGGSP